MASQIQKKKKFARFDVPRKVAGAKGRQTGSLDGALVITPGLSEAFDIEWGDRDGIPVSLVSSIPRILFWTVDRFSEKSFPDLGAGATTVLLAKDLDQIDPHEGTTTLVLSPDDTTLLAGHDRVSWGLFLVMDSGDVFSASVSESGRSGPVVVNGRGTPTADQVRLS